MSAEKIKAIHWAYDHIDIIDHADFVCAVEQKEAQLLKLVNSSRN